MYNILICDDDKDIVNALKIYLSAEGYQIFEAYNGIEAIDIVKEKDIQLILLDIMMPQMDGIKATSILREQFNIPIIFLSAKSEDSDKVLGLNIGADDYITKPFNPLEVIARVKSQLRRYTNFGGQVKKENKLVIGAIELDDET
ncbi:MAG: response regulator transcription factor, partial [Erysipelotrichaceae bacterium]|nr:response regulator transcription factor [Erysipelotrichaceae bacterium]